ncbi:MAG: DUF5343 domain-containing protein [Actinobacteria bacterium]|nr:DUF5343 domain-containing protein [Actinomycetota bacterium]
MAITHDGPAPYAPIAHVLRAIDHYREKAPAAMTKELLMKLGYPDSYATRTLRALRLFELVDDAGVPMDAFKELRRASDTEFPARLEQVIRTAYSEVFEVVDPATAAEAAVDNAFRFYNPGAQRERMVVLFMGLCEAAGMLPPEKAPRRRTMRAGGVKAPARTTSNGRADAPGQTRRTPDERKPRVEPEPEVRKETPDTGPLRERYINMLLSKAESQDQLDDKLLDRIEALLRDDEQKD